MARGDLSDGTAPVAGRYGPDRLREIAMTKDKVQALVGRERPGWDVVDIVEINDESGPSFEVAIRKGGDSRTLLVSEDEQIVAER
jgi:hypothetical protein